GFIVPQRADGCPLQCYHIVCKRKSGSARRKEQVRCWIGRWERGSGSRARRRETLTQWDDDRGPYENIVRGKSIIEFDRVLGHVVVCGDNSQGIVRLDRVSDLLPGNSSLCRLIGDIGRRRLWRGCGIWDLQNLA